MEGGELPLISGYEVIANVPRGSQFVERQSLGSGGIAVLLREGAASGDRPRVWKVSEFGTHVWLRLQQTDSDGEGDLFLCLAYLPPQGSVFWERGASEADVFAEIEGQIAEARCIGEVLLAGDLNARIGVEMDWIETGEIERHVGLGNSLEECFPTGLQTERRSQDATVNGRGRVLLQLLRGMGLSVLNGRMRGDEMGAFTSIRSQGKSVIDLFVASPRLAGRVRSLEVMGLLQELSDHCPVLLTMCSESSRERQEGVNERGGRGKEIPGRVSGEGCEEFRAFLRSEGMGRLAEVGDAARGVVESAQMFQNVLREAGLAAFGAVRSGMGGKERGFPSNAWYDAECKLARRRLREALEREGSGVAEALRKEYRNVVRRKKRLFTKARTAQLVEMAKRDPGRFWKRFKKRKARVGVASKAEWFDYCRGLYGGEVFEKRGSDRWRAEKFDTEELESKMLGARELNSELTEAEVRRAIEGMKKKKAGDLEGFTAELLQAGVRELTRPITRLFNKMWSRGEFPAEWNEGVLVPVFKKGDASDCANYRTITVGPVLGKLYAMVVERRLAPWAERRGLRARGQAGFRHDHRVADHVFTLRALIDRAHAGKHAFAAFVDFSKAFDTIPRDLLWRRMEEIGIHGELLGALRAMYRDVRCRVRAPEGLTDSFESTWGVKQGCPLSPLLFSLYVDPLEEELLTADDTCEIDGDFLSLAGVPVPCLLFADDLVLLSSSRAGLQAMLGTLERFTRRTGLTVNLAKTKVVVFGSRVEAARAGGPFLFEGREVEITDSYRYLGVDVCCTGSWDRAVRSLSAAGLRACHALRQRCSEIRLYDPRLRGELFDSLVAPVLMHGAEVWGATSRLGMTSFGDLERDATEQVHRSFFRGLLGVRASTSGIAILGEFGRFPLLVRRVRAISLYYNRLIGLRGSGRLIDLAFQDSVRLWEEWEFMHDSAALPGTRYPLPRVRGWYGDTLHMLGRLGFRSVDLLRSGAWDITSMIHDLQRRYLTGTHRQGSVKETYDRIRDCLDDYSCAPYIGAHYFTETYRCLARFRTGSHDLAVATGRWTLTRDSPSSHSHRLCSLCPLHRVEDEDHFIFECPAYRFLRTDVYPDLFIGRTSRSLRHFIGQRNQHRVASFIRDGFKTRKYVQTLSHEPPMAPTGL